MITIDRIEQTHVQPVTRAEARPSGYPRMADAELEQYARRTTKRPLLCFALLASTPFLVEIIDRLLGAW
ncbi:hypothetical protein [Paraburkholderia pallida]|uniref:Uncharacterized protein n=1 Tax=Paraburkholderia pallida TaxID=2547399 RepID=A0A4P7CTB2_9BURK|nr:hypothetical protein [Paraburkholderia pallida]QBQ99220.1 hypothetical protein E1956_18620 [Paraburkholderia pallida]